MTNVWLEDGVSAGGDPLSALSLSLSNKEEPYLAIFGMLQCSFGWTVRVLGSFPTEPVGLQLCLPATPAFALHCTAALPCPFHFHLHAHPSPCHPPPPPERWRTSLLSLACLPLQLPSPSLTFHCLPPQTFEFLWHLAFGMAFGWVGREICLPSLSPSPAAALPTPSCLPCVCLAPSSSTPTPHQFFRISFCLWHVFEFLFLQMGGRFLRGNGGQGRWDPSSLKLS